MKETIFHPEARAEIIESFDFYEARLDGLGLRFMSAVEQTVERICTHPEAGAPLAGEFRKRIVPGFPYNVIYRVWQDYIYLVEELRGQRTFILPPIEKEFGLSRALPPVPSTVAMNGWVEYRPKGSDHLSLNSLWKVLFGKLSS